LDEERLTKLKTMPQRPHPAQHWLAVVAREEPAIAGRIEDLSQGLVEWDRD